MAGKLELIRKFISVIKLLINNVNEINDNRSMIAAAAQALMNTQIRKFNT